MESKKQILSALQKKIEEGLPIIATAAGAGLVARVEEKNGADLIVVYNSGLYRMNGIASIAGNLPIGDANQIVYDMGKNQILPMVKSTPVAAGIYGVDPTRDMERFFRDLWDIGYRCVINFPTIGKLSGPIREELEQVGLGFAKEVERLCQAAEIGFVTLAYCYNPKEAELLAEAGIDIIVSHVGLTAGGDVGGEDGGAHGSCNRKNRSDFVGGKAEKTGYHSPVPRRADRESGGCTARSLGNLCRWVCGRIQHRTTAD